MEEVNLAQAAFATLHCFTHIKSMEIDTILTTSATHVITVCHVELLEPGQRIVMIVGATGCNVLVER